MITDPLFYLAAIPAILITGISKGGFGGGLGMVAVPIMALTISPQQAAAIVLPILCAMDVFALWQFRGRWHRGLLATLVPAALAGIVIGALTFRYFSADHIRLLIGTIAVLFSLNFWLRPSAQQQRSPSVIRGGIWGALAGFTSFGVHAGGPPLNAYLLPLRLEKSQMVATTVLFFIVVNYIKLIPYMWLGQFSTENLTTALSLILLAPIGIKLGYYLHQRISDGLFYQSCYTLLFITGLKLLYDGALG